MTSTSYGGAVITGVVTAGAATIPYPEKQPKRLPGIKMFSFHYYIVKFEISLFCLSHSKLSDQTVIHVYPLPRMEIQRSIQHLIKLT